MDDIYNRLVDFHGQELQLTVAMEECAELIKAISKFLRGESLATASHLAEETAHVEFMIAQIRAIIGDEGVDLALDKTKVRAEKRLGREELGGNLKWEI